MSCFISTMQQNRNLFDGQLESKIINSDGSLASNAQYRTSINYMEVDGQVFTCSKASTSTEGFRIALYDANKTFLKRLVLGSNEISVTVNEPTAIYIKICVQSTSIDSIQVELGDKATSYVPYGLEKISHIVEATKSVVPSLYTQLEYIESTGVQYIDTSYIPTVDTKVDLKWLSTDNSGDQAIIGCNWTNNAMLLNIQSNKWHFHSNGTPSVMPSLTVPDIISYSDAAKSLVINGVTYNNAKDSLSSAKTNMKMFGLGGSGGSGHYAKGKLYYLNIYSGDILVREYIPVRRNTDNIVGLYDNVTKSFFTDKNSNNFTAGNNADTRKNIIKCLVGGK